MRNGPGQSCGARLTLRLYLGQSLTNGSEDTQRELAQIRVTHLQGIELCENPCNQPSSVIQTTSADPLLVFQLPRVLSPSALTMPLRDLLLRTSTLGGRSSPVSVP